MNECNHKLKPLRQESFHEGACYHTGSCLIDIFYCENCGQVTKPQVESKWSNKTTTNYECHGYCHRAKSGEIFTCSCYCCLNKGVSTT